MLMDKIIMHLMAFLTGGSSDFCALFNKVNGGCFLPLVHYWHGINVVPILYVAAAFGTLAAVVFLGLGCWCSVRRRPATLAFFFAALWATAAYAASSTLGNLSAGSAVSDTDLFYDVQTVGVGGVKITGLQLRTYIAAHVVTSIATGCQATGGTITTTGTISTQETVTDLSGSNPAITTGYCGGLETLDNASAQTPTIAEAGSAGFPAGWYTDLCNVNAGAQTLTPGAGTVGGGSTLVIGAGSASAPTCFRLISDGVSNYVVAFPATPNPLTLIQPIETAVSLSGCNGSTATMNLKLGSYFYCTVSAGSTTFAVSNPAASGLVSSFSFEITNGGSQTLTWMSGTKWPGGSAPTFTASGVDLVVCSTRDAATTWRCVGSEINSH